MASQEPTRERSLALLSDLANPSLSEADQRFARDALVTLHMPLVEFCARRFSNRGEPLEDLIQVGAIGLIKAIDRFEINRGVEFSTYATPTIVGEIKRHFRDKGWAIKVPRRLQELRTTIRGVASELTQQLGRPPTAVEIAEHMGVSIESVIEGLDSGNAYTTVSLDSGLDAAAGSLIDSLGDLDAELEQIERREAIRPLLEKLSDREKLILSLRYFHNYTQGQIAEYVGVSQMHVSRLLGRTLSRLRDQLGEER